MRQILPYEAVVRLVEKDGYGTYRLFSMPGENFIASSQTDPKEEEYAIPPAKLIVSLREHLDLFTQDGQSPATFMVVFKKNSKVQSSGEVRLLFNYPTELKSQQQTQQIQFAGLQQSNIDELVNARVNQLMSAREAEWQKQREIDLLRIEIAELKKRKPSTRKKNELAGLINLGIVAGSAFITKQWPDTKDVVNKALGAISGSDDDEDDDEEGDEETGFSRPD